MMNPNLLPIVMYSKPRCVQCNATERWLKEHGFRIIKHDVEQSEAAYDYVVALGYQAVPVVVIPLDAEKMAGEHWSGLRPDKLSQLI